MEKLLLADKGNHNLVSYEETCESFDWSEVEKTSHGTKQEN